MWRRRSCWRSSPPGGSNEPGGRGPAADAPCGGARARPDGLHPVAEGAPAGAPRRPALAAVLRAAETVREGSGDVAHRLLDLHGHPVRGVRDERRRRVAGAAGPRADRPFHRRRSVRRRLPAAARHVLPRAWRPRHGLAIRGHGRVARDDGRRADRADRRAVDRDARGNRAAAGGQPLDAPRADDDPRGDDPGVFGPVPRADRVGIVAEAAALLRARRQPLHALGPCAVVRAGGARRRTPERRAQARDPRDSRRGLRDADREAAALQGPRAAQRVVRARAARGGLHVPGGADAMTGLFSQLVMLGSSGMLLTAPIVLWRRGLPAYIAAYRWQSWLLAAVVATIAHFGDDTSLYWVAGALLVLKGIAIPALLGAMRRRVGVTPQVTPFVNTETSLLVASLLVVFAYLLSP